MHQRNNIKWVALKLVNLYFCEKQGIDKRKGMKSNKYVVLSIAIVMSIGGLINTVSANNDVLYIWSGAVSSHSARVNVVLELPSSRVRVAMDKTSEFKEPIYSDYCGVDADKGNVGSFWVKGLAPGTLYYYAVEIDGVMDLSADDRGTLKTFEEGAFSYSFLLGACNFFPNNPVYDKMRVMPALFYLNTGDLHYANPNTKDVKPHRDAYEDRVLSKERESKLLRKMPIAYIWDDHDYCGDNNDGNDGCGVAAKQAYTEYVPHYPLGDPDGKTGIYQAFTAGRVRFIMSDVRSQRSEGHIMSREQMQWFKNEMITARDRGEVIAWVTSVSYSGTKKDNWGGFEKDREEIGNFLKEQKIENLFILSGDAHMTAIDNGTNTDFSTGKDNPYRYPVFQSAALNNVGSDKGGIYSEGGTFPNPPFTGQFGLVTVTDYGGSEICINFKSYRLQYLFDSMKELLNFDFCRTVQVEHSSKTPAPLWLIAKSGGRHYEIRNSNESDLDIKVFDRNGQVYYQRYIKELDTVFVLDLSGLAAGEYFIRVEMGTKLDVARIDIP